MSFKENKGTFLLKAFFIIFFMSSLKVAGDSLLKTTDLQKTKDYKVESSIIRKKLTQNIIFSEELNNFCKDTNYIPTTMIANLHKEYSALFNELTELSLKYPDVDTNIEKHEDVRLLIVSELDNNFQEAQLSKADYCKEYDKFTEQYDKLEESILAMEF